eukprot:scaffold248459_cov84-Cyclotella_meneghiniana.AAC.5
MSVASHNKVNRSSDSTIHHLLHFCWWGSHGFAWGYSNHREFGYLSNDVLRNNQPPDHTTIRYTMGA